VWGGRQNLRMSCWGRDVLTIKVSVVGGGEKNAAVGFRKANYAQAPLKKERRRLPEKKARSNWGGESTPPRGGQNEKYAWWFSEGKSFRKKERGRQAKKTMKEGNTERFGLRRTERLKKSFRLRKSFAGVGEMGRI